MVHINTQTIFLWVIASVNLRDLTHHRHHGKHACELNADCPAEFTIDDFLDPDESLIDLFFKMDKFFVHFFFDMDKFLVHVDAQIRN